MAFSAVVHFVGLDPRIAAWLIDPGEAATSFEDLVAKFLESSISVKVDSTYGNSSRNVVVSCVVFTNGNTTRIFPRNVFHFINSPIVKKKKTSVTFIITYSAQMLFTLTFLVEDIDLSKVTSVPS